MSALDARRLRTGLDKPHFLREILLADTVDSTNQRLAERVRTGRVGPGVLLAAEVQTAGQGLRGRAWRSVPYRSLTFSFTLPDYFPSRPGLLTVGTALAAAEAVRRVTGIEPSIKWPNDLCIGSGKAAGFLAQRVSGPSGMVVIMGVGINVNAVPPRVDSRHGLPPVCLKQFTERETDRNRLLAAILQEVNRMCRRFDGGESGFIAHGLRARSLLLGRRARFSCGGAVHEGIVRDHTDNLGIRLETAAGTKDLPAENASLLWFEHPRVP